MKTILLILCLCPTVLLAQLLKITPQDTQRKHSYLIMRDGSLLRGKVVRQDSSIITVRKNNGELSYVEADQVVRIAAVRPSETMSNVDSPRTVFILKDGSQVTGKFVRRDSTMITVRKSNGQLTYFEPELLVRVDSVQSQSGVVPLTVATGRDFQNRFSPWLLSGQTAFNPEKGRLYYRNTFLLLNEIHYGLTRNLSIGANINPFYGTYSPNNYNNPRETVLGATVRFSGKLTFPIGEQFRFGVHAIYQPRQKGYLFTMAQQVVLQGLMSFGGSQRNATLGYGMRFYPDYTTYNKAPFISVGVMHTISRNLTFLSDNTFYLNPSFSGTELSAALRLNRRRHAFDLGVLAFIQPYYAYYNGFPSLAQTRTYFSPYIAYNLIIGRQ